MYWEPHTSSIDFCESNYLHSPYVVELHNTWSSLIGIASFGLIGAIWNNPTKELRTVLAYLVLLLIGVGSTGLHLSLHWIYQASDELPMLYMSNVLNFMCLEYDAPMGKPHSPNLPYIFLVLSVLHTVVYYRFQDNYVVFFLTYAFGVVLHVVLGVKIVYVGRHKRGAITKRLGIMAILTYLFVGLPVWILDMQHCDAILNISETMLPTFFWRGITPHVLWHFAAAFGTYCAIACVVACRMEELKMPFRLEYLWGIVPLTVRTEDKSS